MSRAMFLTHGKAGSQWMTSVLSDPRVLAYVPNVRFRRQVGQHDWPTYLSETEDALFAPIYGVNHFEWTAFRTPRDRAIRVWRDPRDTVISWVYSMAFSHVSDPGNSLVRAPLLALDRRSQIMLGMERMVSRNAELLRGWSKAGPSPVAHLTTYERVVEDQEGEFRSMFDFLEWPIPDDVLRAVIATHSFEARSGGRGRGELDPFSHHRQGVPGDWRNHFDRELARQFEEAYPHLLVDLGYESTDTWWQQVPEVSTGTTERQDDSRIRDLSHAMARALEERDRRWLREEAAMNERFMLVSKEAEALRLACAERLAVIQDQERHLVQRLTALLEKDDEIRRIQSHADNLLSICDERLSVIEAQARAIEQLRAMLDRGQSEPSEAP